MKLTEKTKKYLVITGGMILGIGLLAAIGMQFGQPPSGDVLPETTQTVTEVIVDPGKGLETKKAPKESMEESGGKTDLVIRRGQKKQTGSPGRLRTADQHRQIRRSRAFSRNRQNRNHPGKKC